VYVYLLGGGDYEVVIINFGCMVGFMVVSVLFVDYVFIVVVLILLVV